MRFDLQPTLTGELIELRPLKEEDWRELYFVASDPLLWEQHPIRERYNEEVFREYFRGAMASGGAFAVIDRKTGRIIGSTCYHDYLPETSQIEIGYTFLARAFWGGKFNGEMKKLLLGHAFRFVDRVIFVVGKQNFRSQRAMEKIGGIRCGDLSDEREDAHGHENFVYEVRKRPLATL